jgi:hypothetical protein
VILENWGATPAEQNGPVIGDDLCPNPGVSATRCITIDAPPNEVFPWLRQMGFGRAGWYSYDWIDNLGRRSARKIEPTWQTVTSGDSVPGGPIDFEAVVVESPRHLVLRVGGSGSGRMTRRLCFTLAYELRDHASGTRLVTRMRARIDLPGGRFVARFILGPGDGIMLRRQLLNVKRRAETA